MDADLGILLISVNACRTWQRRLSSTRTSSTPTTNLSMRWRRQKTQSRTNESMFVVCAVSHCSTASLKWSMSCRVVCYLSLSAAVRQFWVDSAVMNCPCSLMSLQLTL